MSVFYNGIDITGESYLRSLINGTGDIVTIDTNNIVKRRTPTQILTDIGAQPILTNPITGTGVAGQVSFWSGISSQTGSDNLFWNNSTGQLGVGTNTPETGKFIDVIFNATSGGKGVRIRNTNSTGYSELIFDNNTTPDGTGAFVFGYGGTGTANPNQAYFWNRRSSEILFGTNNTERWRITSSGILQSNGAQTIQTSTGNLTLATAAGNGNIYIRPNGNGTTAIGDSVAFNSTVWTGSAIVGKSGTDKVVLGYLTSSTNGAIIGAHNSALNSWASLNYNATQHLFRISETERARFAPTTGNFLLNTTADAGERLQVNGNALITSALLSNQQNLDVDTGATRVIATVSSTTYTAAFFDFSIKNGTNLRAGTIYATHDGTNVVFIETSTADLGNTSGVELSVDLSGGNLRLLATVTTNNWIIKSLVRGL